MIKIEKKLAQWFGEHPPFPDCASLVSLSTGVVGNSSINCHQAAEVGLRTMETYIGTSVAHKKQSRKNTIIPLTGMSNTIKVNNENIVIDPLLIFKKVVISQKTDDDVAHLLAYELTPFPMSLFDERGMRKTQKSKLYNAFPVTKNTVDLKTWFKDR